MGNLKNIILSQSDIDLDEVTIFETETNGVDLVVTVPFELGSGASDISLVAIRTERHPAGSVRSAADAAGLHGFSGREQRVFSRTHPGTREAHRHPHRERARNRSLVRDLRRAGAAIRRLSAGLARPGRHAGREVVGKPGLRA